jgi:hypothetical protein
MCRERLTEEIRLVSEGSLLSRRRQDSPGAKRLCIQFCSGCSLQGLKVELDLPELRLMVDALMTNTDFSF